MPVERNFPHQTTKGRQLSHTTARPQGNALYYLQDEVRDGAERSVMNLGVEVHGIAARLGTIYGLPAGADF